MLRAMSTHAPADRSLHAAIAAAFAQLRGAGLPDSDALELLSRWLGVRRDEVRTHADRELTRLEQLHLEDWLRRRLAHEPVQYITGRAAFRHLDLAVDARVLVPRPETEGLVECVLETLQDERARWPQPRVLDLGTGSGAIALSIAQEWPLAQVTATDASDDALTVARLNAATVGLTARVQFAHGEWYDAIASDDRFEVIVSNPPYIAESEAGELPADVREWEPHRALFSGADGLEDLREIIDEAPRHLVAGGLLALELSENRAHIVAGWFEGAHDWSGVRIVDDLSGRPRVLLARREKGPAIAPAQWGEER